MITTRRSLLIGGTAVAGGALAAGYGLLAQTAAQFGGSLPIPRLIDTAITGGVFDLSIQQGETRIMPAAATRTFGYSARCSGRSCG